MQKKLAGIMLIDLMIGIAISSLIIAALIEIYVSNQQSFKWQIALKDIQYQAKSAINALTSDIKMAGQISCNRLLQNGISVRQNKITIRYAKQVSGRLSEAMQQSNMLHVKALEKYQKDDVLIISDCQNAEEFKVGEIRSLPAAKKIIPTKPLHYLYNQQAEIARFVVNEYTIEDTRSKNPNGSPVFALFKRDVKNQKTKVANNISNLIVYFTAKVDDEWRDLRAHEIDDWSKVAAVALEFDVSAASLKKHWYSYIALKRY